MPDRPPRRFKVDDLPAAWATRLVRDWRSFDFASPAFAAARDLRRLGNDECTANGIAVRLLDWAVESVDDLPTDATARDALMAMVRTLDATNCAACAAPSGLIYTVDLGREIGEHWFEIDEALANYHDAIGQNWRPQSVMTTGDLVWFAYEWNAHRLAAMIKSIFELEY